MGRVIADQEVHTAWPDAADQEAAVGAGRRGSVHDAGARSAVTEQKDAGGRQTVERESMDTHFTTIERFAGGADDPAAEAAQRRGDDRIVLDAFG